MLFRFPVTVALCSSLLALAQEVPTPQLSPGSARKPAARPIPAVPQSVPRTVSGGTPLQVALDREVCVKRVGQVIHGRIVEPVYSFDQIVIPVGAEVTGRITRIEPISGGKRMLAALDADFMPARTIEVTFNELNLADGRRLPLSTTVTPGSGQVIQFVSASEKKEKRNEASERTRLAKQQAHQQWDNAMNQLRMAGRMHRVKRYLEAQLPVHRQFIPAGTVYFAELSEPLDFGFEVMTAEMARAIGGPLPPGSVVHVWLMTPVSSASAHRGDDVEAVLSQPLLDDQKHVLLPQGSRLKGSVRQVQPARRMKKNGQLRLEFRELIPPDGMQQKVEATLEGVQAGKGANVTVDSEGGAEATTPKTRYLATGLSLALAAASGDIDGDDGPGGSTGSRVAGGANGFKLVGMALGFAVRSPALGYTQGAYGAGKSVYSNFFARGHEVAFPKNTAMEVGVGTRKDAAPQAEPGSIVPRE